MQGSSCPEGTFVDTVHSENVTNELKQYDYWKTLQVIEYRPENRFV